MALHLLRHLTLHMNLQYYLKPYIYRIETQTPDRIILGVWFKIRVDYPGYINGYILSVIIWLGATTMESLSKKNVINEFNSFNCTFSHIFKFTIYPVLFRIFFEKFSGFNCTFSHIFNFTIFSVLLRNYFIELRCNANIVLNL